ncbi:hypothetical protein FJ656_14140 [Schumannella luteola]|nr:hypothetical protein FJ656_14140 [Schumannella luteola]
MAGCRPEPLLAGSRRGGGGRPRVGRPGRGAARFDRRGGRPGGRRPAARRADPRDLARASG